MVEEFVLKHRQEVHKTDEPCVLSSQKPIASIMPECQRYMMAMKTDPGKTCPTYAEAFEKMHWYVGVNELGTTFGTHVEWSEIVGKEEFSTATSASVDAKVLRINYADRQVARLDVQKKRAQICKLFPNLESLRAIAYQEDMISDYTCFRSLNMLFFEATNTVHLIVPGWLKELQIYKARSLHEIEFQDAEGGNRLQKLVMSDVPMMSKINWGSSDADSDQLKTLQILPSLDRGFDSNPVQYMMLKKLMADNFRKSSLRFVMLPRYLPLTDATKAATHMFYFRKPLLPKTLLPFHESPTLFSPLLLAGWPTVDELKELVAGAPEIRVELHYYWNALDWGIPLHDRWLLHVRTEIPTLRIRMGPPSFRTPSVRMS